jgi:hypothetical protein
MSDKEWCLNHQTREVPKNLCKVCVVEKELGECKSEIQSLTGQVKMMEGILQMYTVYPIEGRRAREYFKEKVSK